MTIDLELAKLFVANDPRAMILPPEIYNQVIAQPLPIQAFVDSLRVAKASMTLAQKKAAYDRAKKMRDYAEAACKELTV